MKKTLFTVALFTVFLAAAANAQQNGWVSRYWDGCKPSCSWANKPGPGGQCKECNKQNQLLTPTSDANKSACTNDPNNIAYTCWDMGPFVSSTDPNLAYAFAATPSDQCGACYEFTFNGKGQHGTGPSHQALVGKKMIVMASNMGGDVGQGQFDLLVPGGGLGQSDSFSGQLGLSKSDLGANLGGFLSDCPNNNSSSVAANQSCLKAKCAQVFGGAGKEWLRAGCDFYADWLMAANNPQMTYRSVTCPAELSNRYKNSAGNPPNNGGGGGTTYTLTMSVNPNNSGTTNPASSQANISGGQAVNISATAGNGYTFANWMVTSGTATFANPNSATTTVTLSSNATVRANFTQSGGGTTYTLTVNRNPNNAGSTNPAQTQSNITAGTPFSISATANNGYTFTNWTVTSASGTATIANANSATTTVTLSNNATVQANFTQQQGGGGPYTLTVNRNPNNGGTTNPASSQSNIQAGQAVSISATAGSGYTFTNWTVASGSATFANAGNAATTVTLSSNATITANFTQGGTPPGGGAVNWAGTGNLKIEAESLTSSNPAISNCPANPPDNQQMCISSPNSAGVVSIGYINPGNSATYKINLTGSSRSFPMDLRIATGQSSNFTVWVNGSQVGGQVTKSGSDWDAYEIVRLSSNVQLNQGENTIELRFQTAVNVDWIQFNAGTTSVRYEAAKAGGARSIVLRAGARSFTAALPAGHGYSSYKLIDLQGREVRSGTIGDGAVDLRFDNLKHSVQFLRLTGKGNTPLVLKAVTY
jgi:hypothetical protein